MSGRHDLLPMQPVSYFLMRAEILAKSTMKFQKPDLYPYPGQLITMALMPGLYDLPLFSDPCCVRLLARATASHDFLV
ncbi:MAG: hypothetical protein CVT94_08880 [Bacteroidetes bacterium HGW-Bacteroidetes-11]|jgi:hypothetical protein|nr:MAG: hypothetical protein CVT94_08880 [Bacteroidetes bacterium HGW-Bacteroidetes-11]